MSAPFYDDVDDGGDDFPPDHFFDGQGEEDGHDDFLEALDAFQAYSSKRELRIGDSSDIQRFDSSTDVITVVCTDPAEPRLATILSALRRELVQSQSEGKIKLRIFKLEGSPESMKPPAWVALADLINCVASPVELRFLNDRPLSDLPASFFLSLRQYCFDLHLSLLSDRNPTGFLLLLKQQIQHSHSPPISPFAIQAIDFLSLSFENMTTLVQLGRSGPEEVVLLGQAVLGLRGQSVTTLSDLLQRSFWIEWRHHESWFDEDGLITEDYVVAQLNMEFRVDQHNQRVQSLRLDTRSAATTLLRAARALLFPASLPASLPIPSFTTSQPPTEPLLRLALLSLASNPSTISSFPSQPVPDSSPFASPPISPIFTLPYELLDTILSYLSPGHLSTKQHRLVMNWAEDRWTLGAKKAESRTEFLRKTNCWRWESEVERVNLGFGYE